MLLLGPSRSPFVRRVATTLRLYDFEFEQRELGITGDTWQELLAYSPLGRVPVLVLPDNRRLTDSAVILDYLDHKAGAERTLTPLSGPKRTDVMNVVAVLTGALEKAIATAYEVRFRPESLRHGPWVERCELQARRGFEHVDALIGDTWIVGDEMTQADVTAAVAWQHLNSCA